jgi:hypothetical protein
MGPWGIAALVAIAAVSTAEGRVYVKKLFKVVLLAGFHAKETAEEFAGKAIEYKDELVAEIKSENDGHASGNHQKKKSKTATHQAE